MKRRDFILGLGGAALYSSTTRGQQQSITKKRMAQVAPALKVEDLKGHDSTRVYFDELKRHGYVEGETLIVDRYSGEARIERFDSLAREVVESKPDLIFTNGAALTLRFKAATNTIPVITFTGDPIRFGIVSNIARPGGNITGVSVDAGLEIWAKRVEMLAEAVPKLGKAIYISTRENPNGAGGKATQEAAKKLGIDLVYGGLDSPVTEAEYRRVFDSIQRDQVDGIIFSAEFEHYPHISAIVQLVQQISLPTIHEISEFVEAGSLMSYGLDWRPAVRRLAVKSAEILKGANPGEIPYEQVSRFELVINLNTAKSFGLELPPSLLARADKLIE